MTVQHKERAHSKFSASGFERIEACPGSVSLSEGLPSKDSVWSLEGTKAHELLERNLRYLTTGDLSLLANNFPSYVPMEMKRHVDRSAAWLLKKKAEHPHSDFMVETRIYLPFIHPEMFGTFDAAILDYFGTLHVYDFKYGAGVAVSPIDNLQMVFYALGLAYQHQWNFKRVRLYIDQPRIKGYDGPVFWELTMRELRAYVPRFKRAVKRALENTDEFNEGSHCHWCKAKGVCPAKNGGRMKKAIAVFTENPY